MRMCPFGEGARLQILLGWFDSNHTLKIHILKWRNWLAHPPDTWEVIGSLLDSKQ